MRAYRFDDFKSLDSLRSHDEEILRPQPGEKSIRVRAVSLNYREPAMLRGRYVLDSKTGLIPTSGAVGEVVEVGEGVESHKLGERGVSGQIPHLYGGNNFY